MALVLADGRSAPGGTAPRAAVAQRAALWSAEDLLRWALATGVGGIVIAVSWYVCAGDASFNRQIGPLDAAVAGAVVSGLGNAVWLLRGRRALGERRRALLADPVVAVDTGEPGAVRRVSTSAETGTASPATSEAELLVAGEGLLRFHRSDCVLATGRTWTSATREQHEDAGRLPCGVCRP